MADAWIFVAIVAAAGALAAGATALSRPLVALGILFLLASISRVTLETPVGTMRPEQPAIAVVAVVLLAGGRFRPRRGLPHSILAIAVAFGIFLGILALSSALVAPEPASSLRLVAWFAISMVGGIVAFGLVLPKPVDAIAPLAFVGAAKGAVGIAVAATFLVAGPAFDLGIQDGQTIMPRVHAFTWEANLYASFLAMCLPFALEAVRGRRRAIGLVMLVLVVVGLPLGATRGAYLGAVAGLVAYAVVRIALERRHAQLPRQVAVTAVIFLVGLVASNVLLPNAVERRTADEGPSASPLASLPPYPDTVGFRLDRVPVALGDLPQSPVIGLGAESFGQRHLDPSRPGQPDHLAILALAAVYDAGILGGTALAVGFILVLLGLWRAAGVACRTGDRRTVGAAAAFVGSLTSMLVSYQATNAIHFAINWIIVGAAVGLVARTRMGEAPDVPAAQ